MSKNISVLPKKLRLSLEADYVHSYLNTLTDAEKTKEIIHTISACVQNWDDVFFINQCLTRNIPVVILPEIERKPIKESE